MWWPANRTVRFREGRCEPAPSQAGFTLLETLVAFIIVLLASMALFRGGRNGLRSASTAGRVEEAVALAQTRLNGFDAVASQTQTEGDDRDGLHWMLQATPLGSVPVRGGTAETTGRTVLYRVSVRVSWTDGDRSSHVSLQTERLTPLPPLSR